MHNLNQQGRVESSLGIRERWKGSRNRLVNARSTTILSLSKPIIRVITSERQVNVKRNSKANASLTLRERILINQNMQLKHENERLNTLLKQAKMENQLMKRFVTVVWPLVESQLNKDLKKEIQLLLSSKKAIKVVKDISLTKHEKIQSDIEKLKKSLEMKNEELSKEKSKIRAIIQYIKFLENRNNNDTSQDKTIVMDSSNLDNDESNEESRNYKGFIHPGFIRSLCLGRIS